MEHKSVNKSKVNLIIDIILLLLMMPVAGIGILMKYVLISGVERNVIYGNHTDLKLWSLDRHQWGNIHLIISIVFLCLLILHIVLHWRMIVSIYRRMIPNWTLRISFVTLLTVLGLLLISFPLIIKPEIVDKEPLHQNRNNRNVNSLFGISNDPELPIQTNTSGFVGNEEEKQQKNNLTERLHTAKEDYEIEGSQTLQFVADKYNVSASKIAADLKIPENLTGERLGRLKKRYSFTMDDVRNSISNLKKAKQQ